MREIHTKRRNSFKKRKLKTVDGELLLEKPDIKPLALATILFDKLSIVGQALEPVMVGFYINDLINGL